MQQMSKQVMLVPEQRCVEIIYMKVPEPDPLETWFQTICVYGNTFMVFLLLVFNGYVVEICGVKLAASICMTCSSKLRTLF